MKILNDAITILKSMCVVNRLQTDAKVKLEAFQKIADEAFRLLYRKKG